MIDAQARKIRDIKFAKFLLSKKKKKCLISNLKHRARDIFTNYNTDASEKGCTGTRVLLKYKDV